MEKELIRVPDARSNRYSSQIKTVDQQKFERTRESAAEGVCPECGGLALLQPPVTIWRDGKRGVKQLGRCWAGCTEEHSYKHRGKTKTKPRMLRIDRWLEEPQEVEDNMSRLQRGVSVDARELVERMEAEKAARGFTWSDLARAANLKSSAVQNVRRRKTTGELTHERLSKGLDELCKTQAKNPDPVSSGDVSESQVTDNLRAQGVPKSDIQKAKEIIDNLRAQGLTENEIQILAMGELRKIFVTLRSDKEILELQLREARAEAARWREDARRLKQGEDIVSSHPDPIALAEEALGRIPVEKRAKLVELVSLREEIREAL